MTVPRSGYAACRFSTLTKNPSVPVRRGVISQPSGEASAASRKGVGLVPQRGRGLRRRHDRKLRMAGEEGPDLRAVFRRQHRAGDVGDPPARLDQRQPRDPAPRPGPSAGSPARPGASAIWRRGCGARCRCRCRARRSRTRSAEALMSASVSASPFGARTSALWTPARDSRSWIGASWRLSLSVAISRPLPSIIAASASVLPPAPAQRSITCSPGLAAVNSAASCEPSSCTSTAPLMKSSSAWMPGLRASAPSSMRRPTGDHGVGLAPRCASEAEHLVALGLQRIDAQIERRAARHRGGLGHAIVAEHLSEIADRAIPDSRRRPAPARRRAVREVSASRSASVSGAGAKRPPSHSAAIASTSSSRSSLSMPSRRARGRIILHDPGAGGAPPQHVPDQARDRGAVAGAGKAMRGAPVLQRLGGGHALARRWCRSVRSRRRVGLRGSFKSFGWSERQLSHQIRRRIFSAK